jgi:hypothetical protein
MFRFGSNPVLAAAPVTGRSVGPRRGERAVSDLGKTRCGRGPCQPTLGIGLEVSTMDVSMERSTARAIGLAVVVITILVVGKIWQPDDPVQDQVGAQESGSQPASQPATHAGQPGGDQAPTDGQQAAASG